jgi:hypothetical protein
MLLPAPAAQMSTVPHQLPDWVLWKTRTAPLAAQALLLRLGTWRGEQAAHGRQCQPAPTHAAASGAFGQHG